MVLGQKVQSKCGILILMDPDIVLNWGNIGKIWHHTYKELHVVPEEHLVLLRLH